MVEGGCARYRIEVVNKNGDTAARDFDGALLAQLGHQLLDVLRVARRVVIHVVLAVRVRTWT